MRKILNKKFFERPATTVARELLGKYLTKGKTALMITETEAYEGPHDKASHAHRGRTERNKPMWGDAGRWYVYFVYGMYWMLNIVTGKKDYPAAVLIRGVEEYSGPGKLTKALKIDKKLNNKIASKKSGLWIEDRGVKVKKIKKTPRVGVHYAGPVWAKKLYRFIKLV